MNTDKNVTIQIHTDGGTVITGGKFENVEFVAQKIVYETGGRPRRVEVEEAEVLHPVASSQANSNNGEKEATADIATPLPDCLATPPAQALLSKLQAAGLLDERLQPVGLTASRRGVLAQELAVRLGISNTWQVFSELWSMDVGYLRSAYNKGMGQKNIGEYLGKIKGILN